MKTKKANRLMEITVLVPENATENQIIEIKNLIEKYATIHKIENLGVKTSSYPLAKNGVEYLKTQYIFATITASDIDLGTLDRELYKNDNVIRYLFVTLKKITN